MKAVILVMVALLLVSSIHGQTTRKSNEKKLKFGVSYMPAITFRTLKFSVQQGFLETMRNQKETPRYGHNLAVIVQRSLGKKGSGELGVSFSEAGYKTKEAALTWEPSSPNYPLSANASFSYRYLSFSAMYRYVLAGRKIQYYIMPGFSLDAFIERKTSILISYANGKKEKSTSSVRGGFSESGVSIIAAAGVKFKLSNHYAVCLEPTFRRGLISISPDNNSREYLYSVGVNFIVLFSFNK
jgi:hypothetical protein